MASPDDAVRAAVVLCARAIQAEIKKSVSNRQRGEVWVRKWISEKQPPKSKQTTLEDFELEDPLSYRKILRINSEKFEELLSKVHPIIQKKDTLMRCAIPSRIKLEITLRYLATGDSYHYLRQLFRVQSSTISKFVPEVLDAIKQVLWEFIKPPSKPEEWNRIIRRFDKKLNFPNCAGSLDGKHIKIARPLYRDDDLYCHKETYSIILFALVDDDYNFRYVDIESSGRTSAGAAFRDSKLNLGLESNSIGLPDDAVVVGDCFFPLRVNILKSYSRRSFTEQELIFNYRLSRVRRVSENTFGILVWRFGVLSREINLTPEKAEKVVWAACAIHNWLRQTSAAAYLPSGSVDVEDSATGDVIPGQWRERAVGRLLPVDLGVSNNYRREAEKVRERYSQRFVGERAIPWQWTKIMKNSSSSH